MSFARFTSLACGVVALGVSALASTVARAEESPSRVRAAVVDPSNTEYPVTAPSRMQLEFHGNSETDVGYAKYTLSNPNVPTNDYYNFAGRFVLGADLDYGFGQNFFFHGRGQYVAWIRQLNQYQVDVDDVYIQVGQRGVWDFLVGRFMTWRVYRKGLGYDIYTLEDTGASNDVVSPTNLAAATFGPHTYEVNNMFLRGPQGRAGFHVYPTSWSGIEVVGEYGRDGTVNTIGGRAAGKASFGPLSAAVGAEVKHQGLVLGKPVCDQCGIKNISGYGGGLVLDLKLLEIGVNAAIETTSNYGVNDGTFDKSSSGKRKSFGGYLEVNPGQLIMDRRLVLGVGINQTDVAGDADDKDRHVQGAAYIAYPLGFNDGIVKLVLSKADWPHSPRAADETTLHMYAARFRVAFTF